MQSVNDDMDDLFRKAAESYPLKTNSDNWDSVLNKMDGEQKTTPVAPKKNNYKKMLWLLMLIPFAWVCNNYLVGDNDFAEKGDETLKQSKTQIAKTPPAQLDESVADLEKSSPAKKQEKEQVSTDNLNGKERSAVTDSHVLSAQYNTPQEKNIFTLSNLIGESQSPDDFTDTQLQDLFLQTPDLLTVNSALSTDAISLANTTIAIVDSNAQKLLAKLKKQQAKPKSFFITLLAGPDISTIKFQKVTHTGFNLGMMAGYRFTDRFSLQTGLIYNKKTYYSEGQYFSTKYLNAPPDYYIKTVDGSCKMYEVPLVASYSLSSKRNNLVFNAGISSYLMNGENYNYYVVHNGYGYPKNESYKKRSVNLATAAIGGITLRNKVSKNATLNLEPYFKIPLRGVGIGKLPITSGGINISLTKNLF